MMRYQFKISFFVLFCGIIFNDSSFAEMYKWIDEDGKTHYSQSPPNSDVEVKTIKPPPKVDVDSANKKVANQQKKVGELRDERISNEEEKRKAEEAVAIKEKNCNQAKKSYASYQRPRVSTTGEDGTKRIITDEEKQKEMAKAKEQINEYCN